MYLHVCTFQAHVPVSVPEASPVPQVSALLRFAQGFAAANDLSGDDGGGGWRRRGTGNVLSSSEALEATYVPVGREYSVEDHGMGEATSPERCCVGKDVR